MPNAATAPEDDGAPWLSTMLEMAGAGIKEYPGGADNPTILGWARHIGLTFPEMADYANGYVHDSIPFCGLGMAEALTRNGIRPPFNATVATKSFLWANSYADPDFADKLDLPRRGAIVVFKWNGGGGHVGTLESWDAHNKTLRVAGANQSDAVNVTTFRWDSQVVGFFWPRKLAAAQAPVRTPADVRRRMGQAITLAEARLDRNGHIAVYTLPANDGGGSFEVAGINERYHPVMANKLKQMIESGEPDQAVRDAIGDYTATITDVAAVWTSKWGLQSYLRDTVFHRGPTGGAKILQRALLLRGEQLGSSGPKRDGVDGEVGPLTADAMRRQEKDVDGMLVALRKAREDYEKEDVGYRANFWQGFINRWNNQLVVARRFDAEQPKDTTMDATQPDLQQPQQPQTPLGQVLPDLTSVGLDPKKMQEILQMAQIAMIVIAMMKGQQIQIPTALLPGPEPAAPPPPPPPPPPPVVPVTVPVADPTNTGTDLFAKIAGLAGLATAFGGSATGMMETSTAVNTGIASVIPLIGGIIGIFNPTVGKAVSGFGSLIHRWTTPTAAAAPPPQNPPTR